MPFFTSPPPAGRRWCSIDGPSGGSWIPVPVVIRSRFLRTHEDTDTGRAILDRNACQRYPDEAGTDLEAQAQDVNLGPELKVRKYGLFLFGNHNVGGLKHDRVRLVPHRTSRSFVPDLLVDACPGALFCGCLPVPFRSRNGRRGGRMNRHGLLLRNRPMFQVDCLDGCRGNRRAIRREFRHRLNLARPDVHGKARFVLHTRPGTISCEVEERPQSRKQECNGARRDAHCGQEPTPRRPGCCAAVDQRLPLDLSITRFIWIIAVGPHSAPADQRLTRLRKKR